MIERRRAQRINFSRDATITSEGKTYRGSIENISESGMEYFITSFVQVARDFTPDKRIKLDFQIAEGEVIALECDVKWFLRIEPHQDRLMLGMEIINPPGNYREFVKELYMNNFNKKLP